VVIVGGRYRSSTAGDSRSSSPAAMAELLLHLLQLLPRYGNLDRLAVAARPAPPRAARRPRPDHANDAHDALVLRDRDPFLISSMQELDCNLTCVRVDYY
jgi:hypothetical protein